MNGFLNIITLVSKVIFMDFGILVLALVFDFLQVFAGLMIGAAWYSRLWN